MMDEATLRLGFFAGSLLVMGFIEHRYHYRTLVRNKAKRWLSNFGLVLLSTALLRLLLPFGVALWAQTTAGKSWGALGLVTWPGWIEIAIAVLFLDMVIYFQHRMFHRLPILWRLHRVHHADIDFDISTAVRFHPLEIFLSFLIKFWVVALIGASVEAVVIFEILLSSTSIFNHANFAFSDKIDFWIRKILVTPNMHRIHHSIEVQETDSNFGFSFTWWDKIFGTYTPRAKGDPLSMPIGLIEFRGESEAQFGQMLLQPFK